MRTKVFYEWIVNELDGEDIVDVNGWDTLAEALRYSQQIKGRLSEIELVRNEGNEAQGITHRAWAKLGVELPKYFEDAAGHREAKVPQRFHAEVYRLSEPQYVDPQPGDGPARLSLILPRVGKRTIKG